MAKREASKAVYGKDGQRKGFVQKRPDSENPARTTYGIGIDNGNPYRGVSDRSVNTPLGRLDYGYDGDTNYAAVTPNVYAGRYSDPQQATNWAGVGDWEARASRWDNNGSPMYAAGLNFPDNVNVPDMYKSAVTPIGSFEFGTNDGNPGVWADYQPRNNANYYIQALANLLRR